MCENANESGMVFVNGDGCGCIHPGDAIGGIAFGFSWFDEDSPTSLSGWMISISG
jgi:hypothetical protein